MARRGSFEITEDRVRILRLVEKEQLGEKIAYLENDRVKKDQLVKHGYLSKRIVYDPRKKVRYGLTMAGIDAVGTDPASKKAAAARVQGAPSR